LAPTIEPSRKSSEMKRLIIAASLVAFWLSGCKWLDFNTREDRTAQELAVEGMEEFDNGRYRAAIDNFEKLKDWYPFSKYAMLAELKIADAHFKLEQYEDAVLAYENFENLHPRNEAVPYVMYQIGRCYFEQIDAVDRDQEPARKSMDAFLRLKKRFPDHHYAIKADEHLKKCQQSIAGQDFYVGLYYYKTKRFEAALSRFKSVLTNYPDVGIHFQALRYMAMCEASMTAQKKR
jgi:outer membrane protein assembly factor BamD